MRRFWVFPVLLAGLFLAFQLLMVWIGSLLSALLLPLMLSKTDVYLHTPSFDLRQYFPFTAVGLGVGLLFAALDFALHPEDPRGDKAQRQLLHSWRWMIGALGIGLASGLILQLGITYWGSRRRYHAYPPDFQILNWLSLVPPTLFLLVVTWAILQTLQRPRRPAN